MTIENNIKTHQEMVDSQRQKSLHAISKLLHCVRQTHYSRNYPKGKATQKLKAQTRRQSLKLNISTILSSVV